MALFFIVHIITFILGIIGTGLTIISTAMVRWRLMHVVEGYGGDCQMTFRIDGQWFTRWDGLWQTCAIRTYNQRDNIQANAVRMNTMQCHYYETLIILTTDLKAGRILMVFAIVIAIIALIIAVFGILWGCGCAITCCCRRCRGAGEGRTCLLLTAGIGFILAAILVIIPIAWSTAVIIHEICNPACAAMQRVEIGESIYLGWIALFFLLFAGIIFCCYRPCEEEQQVEDRCKTPVCSSQASLQRPVYIPCETQVRTPSQYSSRTSSRINDYRSHYI